MTKTKLDSHLTTIIGSNIRTLRRQHKMNQHELSKILKVSYQQLQKYESGKNRLPIESLIILKNYFCVPYEYFLSEPKSTAKKINQEQVLLSSYLSKILLNVRQKRARDKIIKVMDVLCS